MLASRIDVAIDYPNERQKLRDAVVEAALAHREARLAHEQAFAKSKTEGMSSYFYDSGTEEVCMTRSMNAEVALDNATKALATFEAREVGGQDG